MNPSLRTWAPAALLTAGAVLTTLGVKTQRTLGLRAPLDTSIPSSIEGYTGRGLTLTDDEVEAAGVTDYLARVYADSAATDSSRLGFSLYVGYYDQQTQGRTIHSPKNCLPGAGWEALTSRLAVVETDRGPVSVNRYLIQKGQQRALVFYWYQGRGRVAADEYAVKWNLLRDAEALAARLARQLVPVLRAALPA